MNTNFGSGKSRISRALKQTALSVSLGLCFASGVYAQSNATGSIFGQVEAKEGASVVVKNPATGFTRTMPVDASGRFRFASLPPGNYSVELVRDGQTVGVRDGIGVTISSGTQVDFGTAAAQSANATNLEAITVTGIASVIDVSSTDTRTVFTAEQLEKLPLARDVTNIALLAPSVISSTNYQNASTGGQVTSFGGSAASENAYYINGYPVTNPLTNIGFTELPYDAISQVQVLTGGYGAEFGRSTGGVINVLTKRGTNEWKFGGIVTWEPEQGRAERVNQYYPKTGYAPATDGTLYSYRKDDNFWRMSYGAYASGPIIQDKLFFYASGEIVKRQGDAVNVTATSATTSSTQGWNTYKYKLPRWIGKVDWNITDNHQVEFTAVNDTLEYTPRLSGFSYNGKVRNHINVGGFDRKDESRLYIGKYTGYLTDNLTLTVLYGQQKIDHINIPFNYDPSCPRINNSQDPLNQLPGLNYVQPCSSAATVLLPGANDKTEGGRFDLEYRIGSHDFRFGVDDQKATSLTGSQVGGGYSWNYQRIANRDAPIDASNGVGSAASGGGSGLGAPGSTTGYYVTRGITTLNADVQVKQRAFYLEDRWQLNDAMLLTIGVRNESFKNYNSDGDIYIEQKNQWAPRLGFSWDVLGDSSLKVFANAGRYHLAVPNNVAVRGASAAINTVEYFTYTGIDQATGAPTGLNPIPVDPAAGRLCPGTNQVSSNLECGEQPDPKTIAAKDIKSHFQDEFAVGMEQRVNPGFNYGVKATYRTLQSAIDDTCSQVLAGHCFLFNPGETNTFLVANDAGGYDEITFTTQQLGYPKLKRNYWALDLYAEHPFSNKWYGKIEYTWSKNYGNTEGQLNSETDTGAGGQADVSVTQDWDLPQLMVGANGLLPNHREHQIKAFGFYELTPEWRLGATAIIQSGRPISCTSFYPTPDQGLYNNATYRFCGLPGTGTAPGTPGYVAPSSDYVFSPRGSRGTTPWTYMLNLSVAYTPEWADNHLTLGLDILNVLDRQTPQYIYQRSATNRVTRNPRFGQELYQTDPRSIRLSARWDF